MPEQFRIETAPEATAENPAHNLLYPSGNEGGRMVKITLTGPGVLAGHDAVQGFERVRPGLTLVSGSENTTQPQTLWPAVQGGEKRIEWWFSVPYGITGPIVYRAHWRDTVTGTILATRLVHFDAPERPPGSTPAPVPDPEPPVPDPEPTPEPPPPDPAPVNALEALTKRVEAIEAHLGLGASGVVGPHK